MRIHFELRLSPDWLPIDPSDPSRMVGGTEKLVLRLVTALSESGHEVSVRGGGARLVHREVRFLADGDPGPGAVTAVVSVHADPPADVEPTLRIAWSHAAQWPRVAGDWDFAVVGSDYHAGLLQDRLSDLPVTVLRPGVDLPELSGVRRDRFLYASSPDRGLHRLLAIWPALWRRFGVPLSLTYDLRAALRLRGHDRGPLGARLREVASMLDQPGVVVHGALNGAGLERVRQRSLALLYPLDPVLPHSELLSLSVLEACASACPPVLSPVDAFPSEYRQVARFVGGQRPDYGSDAWVDAVQAMLDDPQAREKGRAFAAARPWEPWVAGWVESLSAAALPRRPANRARQSWLVLALGVGPRGAWRWVAEEAAARGHDVRVLTDLDGVDAPAGCRLGRIHDVGVAIDAIAARPDRVVLSCEPEPGPLWEMVSRAGIPLVTLDDTVQPWMARPRPNGQLSLVAWPEGLFGVAVTGDLPIFPISHGMPVRAVGWIGPTPSPGSGVGRSLAPGARAILACPPVSRPWPGAVRAAIDSLGDAEARHVSGPESAIALMDVAKLLICAPDPTLIASARHRGVPVLVVADALRFSIDPDSPGDRFAHALTLSGEADVVLADLPQSALRLAISAALERVDAAAPSGAARAVRLVEAVGLPATRSTARPPQLVA